MTPSPTMCLRSLAWLRDSAKLDDWEVPWAWPPSAFTIAAWLMPVAAEMAEVTLRFGRAESSVNPPGSLSRNSPAKRDPLLKGRSSQRAYTTRQATYDLRRLKRKTISAKI